MKLEWEQNCSDKLMTWKEAKKYTKSLGKGWRLPTVWEFIVYEPFLEFKEIVYWTSSYKNNIIFAFSLYTKMLVEKSKNEVVYVRCVKNVKKANC